MFVSVLLGRSYCLVYGAFWSHSLVTTLVVTHNKVCSLVLDPFKSDDVCLVVGSHMIDPYSRVDLTEDRYW